MGGRNREKHITIYIMAKGQRRKNGYFPYSSVHWLSYNYQNICQALNLLFSDFARAMRAVYRFPFILFHEAVFLFIRFVPQF